VRAIGVGESVEDGVAVPADKSVHDALINGTRRAEAVEGRMRVPSVAVTEPQVEELPHALPVEFRPSRIS
jgi:hypothetical protein